MKKIITSNGKFNITNALYESIKKNNPELLEVMSIPSVNFDAIVKKYEEITGKDYNSNNENKILSLYFKCGSNINKFGEELEKEIKKESEPHQLSLPGFPTDISNKSDENNVEDNNDNVEDNVDDTDLLKKWTGDSNTVKMKNDYLEEFDNFYLTTQTINTIIKIIDNKIKNIKDTNRKLEEKIKKDKDNQELIKEKQNNENVRLSLVSIMKRIKDIINGNDNIDSNDVNENYILNKKIIKESGDKDNQKKKITWTSNEISNFEKANSSNSFFTKIRKILRPDKEKFIQIDGANTVVPETEIMKNPLSLFTDEEMEEILSTMSQPIKGNTTEEKMTNTYKLLKHDIQIIKDYTFESDVPKSILEFYEKVKEKTNEILYASNIQTKFCGFGEKDYIGFMKDDLKEFYVNEIAANYNVFLSPTDIKLYDVYKETIQPEEYWKNAAVIYANTSEAYKVVQSKINETLNQWQNIKMKSNRIIKNMNTNTQMYLLLDTNKYDFKNITDVHKRNSKSALFNYNTNNEYMNIRKDTELVKSFKRYYFIVLTEGYFKKGELLSKLGNKIKNKFLSNGGKTLGSVGIGRYN